MQLAERFRGLRYVVQDRGVVVDMGVKVGSRPHLIKCVYIYADGCCRRGEINAQSY
jgi:hypothetical protein